MKVNKETEVIKVIGYMGKVTEVEGKKIDLNNLELYLVKSSKFYEVYEKQTGKTIVSPKKTKKETLQELENTLNTYMDKLNEFIQKAIDKNGLIKDHALGSWIR